MSRILVLITLPFTLFSEEFRARVTKVVDGDSVNVLRSSGKQELKLRLYGIDAPELKQAYGKESLDALKDLLVKDKEVFVNVLNKDRYGRLICELHLNKHDISVNEWMVSEGFAWHYARYAPNDIFLQSAEEKARNNKQGLWSSKDRIPPWEYRKKIKK